MPGSAVSRMGYRQAAARRPMAQASGAGSFAATGAGGRQSFSGSTARQGRARSSGRQSVGSGGRGSAGAFGNNPWSSASQNITSMIERLSGASPGGSGSSSSTSAAAGMHVAKPDDPAVRDYMSHVMGGQRKMLADYVRQAAGAGIKRGGLNVRGGPALESSLHKGAMEHLASGYGKRFKEAMNYNKYLTSTMHSRQAERMRDLTSMLGMQHRYLSSQADWQNRLADRTYNDRLRREQWARDDRLRREQRRYQLEDQRRQEMLRQQELERQEPFRNLQLEQARRQAKNDAWRSSLEREAAGRQRTEQLRADQRWSRAMDLGSFGNRPWSPADLHRAERAFIEQGMWSPLNRSLKLTFKGGVGRKATTSGSPSR